MKKGNSKIEYCGCTIETSCEACTKKQMDRFKREKQRWEFFVDGIQSINQNLIYKSKFIKGEKQMKIINLIGEPSARKSTIAAELFAKMKKAGYNVELVTEYAKDMVWENRNEMFSHQDYIFAKQNRRLARLNGKVDYVITDAPLILSLYYLDKSNTPLSFAPFIKDVVSQYDNDYFFIKRAHKYESIGRYQTEEEAKIISKDLLNLLIENNVDFTILHSDEEVADQILKKIENQGFNHEFNH